MARIRTIKPDFWTDGKVVSISPFARLLFIGMWNFALCDKGHVADDATKLRLQVLPNDDVDIDALITELLTIGLIRRVTQGDDGRTFLHVKRLPDHQKTDTRWTPRCPACALDNTPILTATHASSGESRGESAEHDAGKERKGKERDTRIDNTESISAEFEAWWKLYPLKKARGQAEKAFRAARKTADLDTLTAAVQEYSKIVAGQDPKYIAYGSTWLNGKRWLDEDIAPATAASVEDWLRDCWNRHDTAAITERCGLEFHTPDIPDDVTDAKAYVLQARRDWIKTNHDDILARILQRETRP